MIELRKTSFYVSNPRDSILKKVQEVGGKAAWTLIVKLLHILFKFPWTLFSTVASRWLGIVP